MFHYSHPNAFFQPHLHPRGCCREYLLGLGCQGCSGACSTPFSRLLQPSVRGVVDLEVMTFGRHPLPYPSLCGRVTLSVGVHSVCAPVSKSGDWLASFDLREAYIPVTVHLLLVPFFASCYMTRSTSSKLCALASPGSAGLHLGHGSCFNFTPFSGYPYASIPRHLAGPVFLSGVSPRGSSTCPPTLSSFWDCLPSQVFQPHTFPGSAVSVGRLRFHLFQGFSVGGTHLSAAICNRRIYVMRLDYREPVAVASRRSFFASSPSSGRLAFFLSWLASFLAATWDCSPSALPP